MFELVVVWETGDRDVYKYDSRDSAERHGRDMKMALGDQIAWYGIRKELNHDTRRTC